MRKQTLVGILVALAALFGYLALRVLVTLYTDWLWFGQLDYWSTFVTIASAKALALVIFWGLFVALAGGNVWLARIFGAHTREMQLEVVDGDSAPRLPLQLKRTRWIWMAFVVGLGFFAGAGGTPIWIRALRYWNPVPFGLHDPIFGREISFYVFELPLYDYIYLWLIAAWAATSLLVLISYLQDRSLRNDSGSWVATPYVIAHVSILAAGLALLLAWGYWLKEYGLLYSYRKDAFFGAGYTDLHAQIYAYRIMLVLSIGAAILLAANYRSRQWRILRLVFLGYVGSLLVLSWFFPILFERFVVRPNELSLEAPYIRHSIDHTRKAYGLDRVEEVDVQGISDLTYRDIETNQTTIQSIPLWDRRPLMDTYGQLQEIRSYYHFGSVDVDRYRIGTQYRQVMLAAREFSRQGLAYKGETWVNRHLVYTHGYGICMSPANEIVGAGLPDFYIKDIPPVSPAGFQIERPEIYYGEGTRDYVIVRSKTEEFDYPRGDENVYTTYAGLGGVPVNSLLRRLAFAVRFGDPYLLVTDNLTSESRILFDRDIGRRYRDEVPRRFHKLAPFLQFDDDPYLTTVDGRLVWIQDAYTVTNMYPYAEPYGRPYVREMNYIRNSVKITLDAYDGTVTFYVWDSEDPLIRTYMAIFPDLFKSKDAMPQSLRDHVRYPTDLFEVQSSVYNTYHMTSPQVFYNREDVWEPAVEIYGVSERPKVMNPYYLIVKLPEAEREEYVLMLPATPARKANMIAWLSARCDEPNYGRLMVYKLPKEKMIYGPMLIERRIDQDTDISREITLWSQRGSDVLRGNLLVIPIGDSFIYVEPLYLRATQSGMPELKRVLVVHGEKLTMAKDLRQGLEDLFSDRPGPEHLGGKAAASSLPSSAPVNLSALAKAALEHFDRANGLLQSGDFAGYGESVKALRQVLIQLDEQAKRNGR